MIIEFIGSTGAGKTTLITKVQSRLAKATQVTSSFELIATPLGLQGISNRMTRNLIQEVAVLPIFIRTLCKNKAIVAFTLRMLKRQANFSIFTINNLRSIERKIGVYEKIRRYSRDRIILVDEGTILLAHKVFVFTNVPYSSDEIAKFINLIPVPDLVVYIRAPIETLIQRTLQRPDPPREIRKNRHWTDEYINRAVAVFEQIVENEILKGRILIVENPESTSNEMEAVADYVAELILNFEPPDKLPKSTSLQGEQKND